MDEFPSPAVALAVSGTLDLIARTQQGEGTRLPGERALAESIGVSRTTLRAALQKLEDDGFIEGHPQRGWYVRRRGGMSDTSTELESFTEVARARGLAPTAEVLTATTRRAHIEEAESLGLAPASRLIEIRRLRRLDDVPVCIDRSMLPESSCTGMLDADLTQRSLYQELQSRCGIFVTRSASTLQARSATTEEAALLDLDAADPVLEIVTVSFTGIQPILLSEVVYRGDSYRFQADLRRDRPY